jgi:DNA-binding CsgD family transcriptional regulator
MEESKLLSPINITENIPLLKSHLLHILDTTQLLLNLEYCTVTLTTVSGDDALSVRSSVAPASAVHDKPGPAPAIDLGVEEALQFRQRLELDGEHITSAGCTDFAPSSLYDLTQTNRSSMAKADCSDEAAPLIKLRLVRQPQFGLLTYAEQYAIQRVLQSINRAIISYIDNRSQDYYASMLDRLLVHFCIGVIKLDLNFAIVEKSSLVDQLLESTRSYRCESNRLVKIVPRDEHIVERAIRALENSGQPYSLIDMVATPNEGQCAIVVAKLAPKPGRSENGYLVYILCSVADHFETSDLLDFWHITPAEKRVLACLARFGSIKKVAIKLGISPNTVKSQLKSAYKKLGVDNKISLLRRFSLLRLIDALISNR